MNLTMLYGCVESPNKKIMFDLFRNGQIGHFKIQFHLYQMFTIKSQQITLN